MKMKKNLKIKRFFKQISAANAGSQSFNAGGGGFGGSGIYLKCFGQKSTNTNFFLLYIILAANAGAQSFNGGGFGGGFGGSGI